MSFGTNHSKSSYSFCLTTQTNVTVYWLIYKMTKWLTGWRTTETLPIQQCPTFLSTLHCTQEDQCWSLWFRKWNTLKIPIFQKWFILFLLNVILKCTHLIKKINVLLLFNNDDDNNNNKSPQKFLWNALHTNGVFNMTIHFKQHKMSLLYCM